MPLEPIEEHDLDLKDKFIEKKADNLFPKEEDAPRSNVDLNEGMERKEGVVEKDDSYSKIVAKIKTQAPQTTVLEIEQDASNAGKLMDTQSRISNLLDIAMQKGVFHAVKVAKHLDDNYVLDEFHDKLVMDEFHDALIEKGLIKDM